MKKIILCFLAIWFCCAALLVQAQSFDPQGKLDPFIDLTTVREEEDISVEPDPVIQRPPLPDRPPGLAGLFIDEVTITGLVVGEESKVVLFRGVDNFTYLAREGNKLFDGSIVEISEEGVVFAQEVVDQRGNKETREVVKRLFTEGD